MRKWMTRRKRSKVKGRGMKGGWKLTKRNKGKGI